MMKGLLASILIFTGSFLSGAQSRPVFPMQEGKELHYTRYNAGGEVECSCKMVVKDVKGNFSTGSLNTVYYCHDEDGEPFFDGDNAFTMGISRSNGNTAIIMYKMAKALKAMKMITSGDVSAITVPMTVGDKLPDTDIDATLGRFKASLHISNKKVLDHKTVNIKGKAYECWLVHEEVETKTPFFTNYDVADTWYAEGIGCVSQKIYDAKGRLKGTIRLTGIQQL